MNKSALVLGATGLVGSNCLNILLNDPNYVKVTIIVRKSIATKHPRMKEVVCHNFAKLDKYAVEFNVDHVFCCIGTTIKIAGSKNAFNEVDFDIPVSAVQISAQLNVDLFSVISAAGANKESGNFYLRTKGLMEEHVKQARIKSLHIFRPGLIIGDRKERRPGEKIAQLLMPVIDKVLFGKWKKYSSISAFEIAQSMINAAIDENLGEKVYTFVEMKKELN